MRIYDHFDFIAPHYDRLIRSKDANKLIGLLGLPKSGYVLDAGGGTGRISQNFPAETGHVIIADLSLKMLMASKQKESLVQVCSYSEKLPFEDGLFEAISMVDALHHVFDQKQTCEELWRLLKPGGRLVIEEPDPTRSAVKLLAVAEKMLLMRSKIIKPEQIASFFKDKEGRTQIVREGYNAWVIYDKPV